MQKIEISEILQQKVPDLKLSCIACKVELEDKNAELWQQIKKKIGELHQNLEIGEISQLPAIAASRKAYKACGKDPARYRLSAEALLC